MQVTSTTSADINAVLSQMRALRDRAQAGVPLNGIAQQDIGTGGTSTQSPQQLGTRETNFGGALKSAIDSVNQLQQTAGSTSNGFLSGEHSDLVKLMVDGQKANLGFQAMVQVRNRMVSAYQDIMNMPI